MEEVASLSSWPGYLTSDHGAPQPPETVRTVRCRSKDPNPSGVSSFMEFVIVVCAISVILVYYFSSFPMQAFAYKFAGLKMRQ